MVIHGDCLVEMRKMKDNSVDSIVTDPPYGLSFMGKGWDHGVPGKEYWEEALRVAKPGAHLLAFGGTRTYHRLVCAIEDAGWEIRDMVEWVYGSGFPKSLDIGKAIDKEAGAKREVVGYDEDYSRRNINGKYGLSISGNDNLQVRSSEKAITAPATAAAKQWDGYGTALKPSHEPIVLARKPVSEKTIVKNILKWGTGGINIEGCRVECTDKTKFPVGNFENTTNFKRSGTYRSEDTNRTGRFPANLIHDGSDEVKACFPDTTGIGSFPKQQNTKTWKMSSKGKGLSPARSMGDSGSAMRFFYCAKASKKDREEGCEGLDEVRRGAMQGCVDDGEFLTGSGNPRRPTGRNNHPTVKPTSLMRYLCKLVTPPGGVVLDPFAGSGSTGKAAKLEGFKFILIDKEKEYCEIAKRRTKQGEKK